MAAYEHLLARQDGNVHFLCFDRFCADPAAGLAWLADILAVDDPTNLLAKHSEIRPPADHAADTSEFDDGLLARAQDLFARCQGVV